MKKIVSSIIIKIYKIVPYTPKIIYIYVKEMRNNKM